MVPNRATHHIWFFYSAVDVLRIFFTEFIELSQYFYATVTVYGFKVETKGASLV